MLFLKINPYRIWGEERKERLEIVENLQTAFGCQNHYDLKITVEKIER